MKIDIWGCCTSRDVFGFNPDAPYKVNKYFQNCSLVSQFSPKSLPLIELDDYTPLFKHKVFAKWTKADVDGSVVEQLSKTDSEWLIMDFRTSTYPLIEVKEGGTSKGYVTGNNNEVMKILNSTGHVFEYNQLCYSDFQPYPYLDKLVEFAKSRYGDKIILIEALEATDAIDNNGIIKTKDEDSIIDRKYFEQISDLYFIKKTGCYYVKCPWNIMSDDRHKWGPGGVHYVSEFYEYALHCIDIITIKHSTVHPSEIQRELDILYLEACSHISEIRLGLKISINNSIKRAESFLLNCDANSALKTYEQLLEQGFSDAFGFIGRMYRDGKGVEQNLNLAAEWMRKAVNSNVGWAKNELFDILLKIGTPKAYEEMNALAMSFAESGDGSAIHRLGKAYKDGKGVEKNLESAAEWMRKAIEIDVSGAKNDLFDILWMIGTPDAYEEMIETVAPLAENGDSGAMLRLGRAYRDGKGVMCDLSLAAEWMRKSAEAGMGWAKNELFDTLWRIGTPEAYDEMIAVITEYADKGDGFAMCHLGRAYRAGKGVPQNLHLAAEWMRKSADKGIGWAKNELFDTLWRIGTPDAYDEMIAVITEYAETGNANAMLRLGRAYLEGKGVPQNQAVAIEWLSKASKLGSSEARTELKKLGATK